MAASSSSCDNLFSMNTLLHMMTIKLSCTTQPNPQALAWTEVDQRTVILLEFSLTEEAAAEVLSLTTAREIWLSLEALLTVTFEHIHSLRDSLRQLTKGTASVSDYCHHLNMFTTAATVWAP
ncbi:hypothetical protein Tco_0281272 [Tanacetum coccineum]